MISKQMALLGEAHGVKWYWAQPGEFEAPGVYYLDGEKNVLVQPDTSAEKSSAIKALEHIAGFAGTRSLKTIKQIREYAKYNANFAAPVAAHPQPSGISGELDAALKTAEAYNADIPVTPEEDEEWQRREMK